MRIAIVELYDNNALRIPTIEHISKIFYAKR